MTDNHALTPALVALEDGTLFWGESIGAVGEVVGEVVFNTSMTGYQEIFTDPSYAGQIVALTYPHIGNVGVNQEDVESENIWARGVVVRNLPALQSNWRSEQSLAHYLKTHNIIAASEVDTRQLTRVLREHGAMRACIVAGDEIDAQKAVEAAKAFPGLQGMNLAKEVTTQTYYEWAQGSWQQGSGYAEKAAADLPYHVVLVDFGVKRNIMRLLVDAGCHITVVPATTSADDILEMAPDGVLLSNGPGDPAACAEGIATAKKLMGQGMPLFGICFGHQIIALACGAQTEKMKFGHHGANHPVQDLVTGQVAITSQNHGFSVIEPSLPDALEVTHRSLFDQSIQGLQHKTQPVFSFQGHPEASPGPHDLLRLFERFVGLMKKVAKKEVVVEQTPAN